MASIYPLLLILMYCLTETIPSADFGTDVRSHPRFRLLAGFRFCNVSEIRISLKREMRIDKLDSLGRLFIFDFTPLAKQDQSMTFPCHGAVLGTTG